MSAIELRTLGTLDLRAADGRELHSLLAQSKRIALLAYLCTAQPSGFHRRDKLLGLFWPDVDHDHARASLRKSIHVLRHSLGEDAVVSRGDEDVSVNFDLVFCDAVKFEEKLRTERFEEALELYRGDLLPGFFVDEAPEFEQWLASERARLRSSAARAALAVASKFETLANLAAAITWTRRSLELSHNDESALRRLIDLQHRAGDRGGAIHSYEAFAEQLASDYRTEPSGETRSLIERIRAGDESQSSKSKAGIFPREELDVAATAAPSVVGSRPKEKQSGRREKALFVLAAASVLVAAGFVSNFWGRTRTAPSRSERQYSITFDSTEAMIRSTPWSGRIAMSQDGSWAYIGGPRSQLLIRPHGHLHPFAVPGTEGAASPFFSPDGKQVGFLREQVVQIVPASGGSAVTVSDSLNGVAGASWGRDGYIYVDGRYGLVRVAAKAGAVPHWFTKLDSAAGEDHHSWPDVLPNGKGVLFTVAFIGRNGVKGGDSYAIGVADIPSGKHRKILDDAMYARYATPGYLLYITTNKALMVVPFDQESMNITGEAHALTEGMRLGTLGSADLAVDTTGTLIYATGAGEGKQELTWVTRDGKEQAVDPDWSAFYMGGPTLSPDGKSVAQTREDPRSQPSIWIKRLDRGSSIKLVVDTNDNHMPAWTPDGRSVTYASDLPTGGTDLWTQRVDRSAHAVLQFHGKSKLYNPRWTPDGKWLLFQTDAESPGAGDILGIRPGIDTVPVPVVATRATEISPAISPNGRWLAYVSNETGADEIYVVRFPNTGTAKWAISKGGGTEPVWSHRGNELFYRDASGNLVAVELETSPTFSLARTTVLFPAAGFSILRWNPQYAVALDDQRFLFVRPLASAPDKLIIVENWLEELKTPASGSARGLRHR